MAVLYINHWWARFVEIIWTCIRSPVFWTTVYNWQANVTHTQRRRSIVGLNSAAQRRACVNVAVPRWQHHHHHHSSLPPSTSTSPSPSPSPSLSVSWSVATSYRRSTPFCCFFFQKPTKSLIYFRSLSSVFTTNFKHHFRILLAGFMPCSQYYVRTYRMLVFNSTSAKYWNVFVGPMLFTPYAWMYAKHTNRTQCYLNGRYDKKNRCQYHRQTARCFVPLNFADSRSLKVIRNDTLESGMCKSLKINERIEYKLLSLTYKVLTTAQPSYLHNLLSSTSSQYPLFICCHSLSPANHLLENHRLLI